MNAPKASPQDCRPSGQPPGFSIARSATPLRNYAAVERARLKILAGWFLRIGSYEHKYRLAYHLYDCSEHVTWMRARLKEMRAGNPDASVCPELKAFLEECKQHPTKVRGREVRDVSAPF